MPTTTFSPADWWRPDDRSGPECGYTFRGKTCTGSGAHHCEPRADRVVAFFPGLLVHTKGARARQRFTLEPWQEADIVRPLFGEVLWSAEWGCYVRRYRTATIVMGRKNGKSGLLSGIALYLLVGDDEESAEVYGAAKDTKQAGKVFEPAARMVQLSQKLSKRLKHNRNARRLIDEKTASYYEIITADAEGELGHNPHGFILDEVLSQPDDSLWNAMRTGAGARLQPLLLCITTETDKPTSFGATFIDEADRIMEDPARAPHQFAYVRKLPRTGEELDRLHRLFPGHPDLPVSTDVFDEANWRWPNPALDAFLSRAALREEALEAHNQPTKENSFRQYRMNQRVSQTSRWMPMHLYQSAANVGAVWLTPEWGRDQLAGRIAYGGFDLAAKFDLAAWCLVVPDDEPDGPVDVLWRFWLPEEALPELDRANDHRFSQWARDGWISVHEGAVLDYDRIVADIGDDGAHFAVRGADGDEWSTWPVINKIADALGLDPDAGEIEAYKNTYDRMSPGLGEAMALARTERLRHHANPVAAFCFESVEVRKAPYDPNLIRPDKPERDRSGKRIDAVPTLAMALNRWTAVRDTAPVTSAYEEHGLEVV